MHLLDDIQEICVYYQGSKAVLTGLCIDSVDSDDSDESKLGH